MPLANFLPKSLDNKIKRGVDIAASTWGLMATAPILVPASLAVWLQDFESPFYVAPRVGRDGKTFKMVKLRSMVKNADKTGVSSTANDDRRITTVGRVVRKYKLDELTQLWNVLKGDMSLVGPRPNVKSETDLYTAVEKNLLKVRPGITDLASIVFADEGDILAGSTDPDGDYNRLIRPWKSRLALFSMANSSIEFDARVVLLTAQAILSRPKALAGVVRLLEEYAADPELIRVASRRDPLVPTPPP